VLAALVALFLLAPGSRQVRHTFFNPTDMWQAFVGDPKKGYYSVGEAIWLNIRMFLIAEVLILIAGAGRRPHPAVDRAGALPAAHTEPIYVDFFRGVPLIL
jgi:polar amino acid transport system permease protein